MLYLLNTASGRRAAALLRSGALAPSRPPGRCPRVRLPAAQRGTCSSSTRRTSARLTPLVAEELRGSGGSSTRTNGWKRRCARRRCSTSAPGATPPRILRTLGNGGTHSVKTTGRDPGEGDSARAQVLRRYRTALRRYADEEASSRRRRLPPVRRRRLPAP